MAVSERRHARITVSADVEQPRRWPSVEAMVDKRPGGRRRPASVPNRKRRPVRATPAPQALAQEKSARGRR
jgi:hypothetical protein